MTIVRHMSQCCSLCYSFSFNYKCPGLVGSEFTTAIVRVVHISLRSLHHMQYVRLLLVLLRHFPVRHVPVHHFPVLQIPVLQIQLSRYNLLLLRH